MSYKDIRFKSFSDSFFYLDLFRFTFNFYIIKNGPDYSNKIFERFYFNEIDNKSINKIKNKLTIKYDKNSPICYGV